MDAYHALAQSYDSLTLDVDYDAVVAFYMQLLDREGLKPRTAADLACGTGSVALLLAQKGMQVIGVDMSEEMLCVAAQKAQEQNRPIRFICQKLQELHLPKAVDLAVCALDSLDYITDPEDCRKAIPWDHRQAVCESVIPASVVSGEPVQNHPRRDLQHAHLLFKIFRCVSRQLRLCRNFQLLIPTKQCIPFALELLRIKHPAVGSAVICLPVPPEAFPEIYRGRKHAAGGVPPVAGILLNVFP